MVYVIRSRDNQHSSRGAMMSKEEAVARRIRNGSCTDSDINFVMDSGDASLRRTLDETHNMRYKDKKHIDRLHGEGLFDGRDNDGNLFKDTVIGPLENPTNNIIS